MNHPRRSLSALTIFLGLILTISLSLSGCASRSPEDQFVELLQRAELGYVDAQTKVAFRYMTGRGVPKNRVQATRWYRAAALQGSSDANAALVALGTPFGGGITRSNDTVRSGVEDIIDGQSFGAYHALVIGNAAYRELAPLVTSVNDAVAVGTILRDQYGFRVQMLIDADWEQMRVAMGRYRQTLGEQDNLLIYYAGHGWSDDETNEAYWLPVDANADIDTFWISNATIATTLRGIRARHVMVVADSCFSGTLVRGLGMVSAPRTRSFIEKLNSRRSRTAMTSGGVEPVVDSGKNGHSVFANAFLGSLERNETVLDGTSLFSQIRQRVMANADQTPSYGTIRSAGHEDGDFLFVRAQQESAP